MNPNTNSSFPHTPETDFPVQGKVQLVGAGCHDASWLTRQAQKALEEADVVVYDDLVDPSILQIALQADRVYQGKRGYKSSARQQDINNLLIDLTRRYKKVVRLKGGDPMIFGRAMEEIEALENAGIEVEIIPGISSFYGLAAKEHFGLTQRHKASRFLVTTASKASTDPSKTDWKQLAQFDGTLVFMMGMARLQEIADNLIAHGLDPQTPACVITSPQMSITDSLYEPVETIARAVLQAQLEGPGILYVGGSTPRHKPVHHFTVGLTCTPALNTKIASQLGPQFQTFPLLKPEFVDYKHDWKKIFAPYKGTRFCLVFTSQQGAERWMEQLREQSVDLRQFGQALFACIGPSTAHTLGHYGIYADYVPEIPSSDHLADLLNQKLSKGMPVFLLQSEEANPILAQKLKANHPVLAWPLYKIQFEPLSARKASYIVFGSAQEAIAWKQLAVLPTDSTLVCISQRVADLLKDCSVRPLLVADTPSASSLVQTIRLNALED